MSLFYKTNNPAVLTETAQHRQQLNQMRDDGLAFRDSFAATNAIFEYSMDDNRFTGLIFEPPKDSRFWTKPDRRSGTQSPRSKVPKMTPEEKQQHTQLLQQWSDTYPKTKPQKRDIFKSLGTDWGMVFLSGLVFFEHQGFVYIETNITLGDHVIEIVGSEYQSAKAAFQAVQKKEVQS